MPEAVLAGRIELDLVMVRVLDRGDREAALPGQRDQLLDQRGLAAAGAPHDGGHAHQPRLAPSSRPTAQAARPAPPPMHTCRRPPRSALWPVNRLSATP